VTQRGKKTEIGIEGGEKPRVQNTDTKVKPTWDERRESRILEIL